MHVPLNVIFTYEATRYIPPKTWYSPGNPNHRGSIRDLHICGTPNIILVIVFVAGGKNK
jgi:hypothetical protein